MAAGRAGPTLQGVCQPDYHGLSYVNCVHATYGATPWHSRAGHHAPCHIHSSLKQGSSMAFSEIEQARNLKSLRWFMEQRRPPEHIRPQLDIGYAVVGQTFDIFEIRPDWQDKNTIRRSPVARVKYIRSRNEWRLYWMRSDLKWHLYEPDSKFRTLLAALTVIHSDPHCCFFG